MIDIYSLIIVDDEYVSCELLEKYVTDYCKDFEIAGIFRDGDEAISFLEKRDVELVITDIKMPRVSGIEVAKYISENKPYINIIAVSAYSEFEYAKEMMKYGVSYYLLKFVDINEFLEAIDAVRSKLSLKNEVDGEYDELMLTMFFYDLFENNFSSCGEAAGNYHEFEQNDFYTAQCLKLSIFLDEADELNVNDRKYQHERVKRALLGLIKLLNPHLFVDVIDSGKGELSFLLFHHGRHVSIDEKSLGQEIEGCFGLRVNSIISQSIYLQDACLGNGVDDEYEKQVNPIEQDISTAELPVIVRTAVRILEENYNRPIIRSEIAERIHVNPIYLSKIFKEHIGKSLTTYLYERRMKQAMELAEAGQKISEICDQVGYRDERAFRRAFKKYTGYSVSEYKKLPSSNVRDEP